MLYFCGVLEIIPAPLSWERLRFTPQMQRGFYQLWNKESLTRFEELDPK
jgi:hypothetical protein